MRIPFTSKATLVVLSVIRSLVWAIETDQQPPSRPVASHNSYMLPLAQHVSQACRGEQSILNITIQNYHDKSLFFYVTGKTPDANSSFVVLRRQGDCYTWSTKPEGTNTSGTMPYYFVNATDESNGFHNEIQVNSSTSFVLPGYTNSARLYVSRDKLRFGTNLGGPSEGFVEPSSTNKALPEYNITWQFIEFTYGEGNFILNPSYVDFAAMSLDLTLKSGTQGVGPYQVPGLEADALDKICLELQQQTQKDNQSWTNMCLTDGANRNLRAISANQYLALYPDDKMRTYYDEYVDKVWEKYSDQNLTINTQDNGSGSKVDQGRKFTCRVKAEDSRLWCGREDVPDEAYSFRKPTTAEIMGCVQGSQDQNSQDLSPFTVTGWNQSLIVPRLCAAFTRSTLLLEGGDVQPNSNISAGQYYTETITNHYSRIIHENLVGHIGYAFAYDDTNPASNENTTSNAGGVIHDADPQELLITVR